jgi:hypothetical protein
MSEDRQILDIHVSLCQVEARVFWARSGERASL